MDSLTMAINDTLINSKLSAQELAERLGVSYQVLVNRCNPNNDCHKLGVSEALALMLQSNNPAIFFALKAILEGDGCIGKVKKKNLVNAVLDVSAETGELASAYRDAMADGHISEREKRLLTKIARKSIEQIEAFIVSTNDHSNDMAPPKIAEVL